MYLPIAIYYKRINSFNVILVGDAIAFINPFISGKVHITYLPAYLNKIIFLIFFNNTYFIKVLINSVIFRISRPYLHRKKNYIFILKKNWLFSLNLHLISIFTFLHKM